MCLVQKKGFPYYLGEAGEQIAKGHVEKKENCSPPKSYWENWGKFWGKKNKAGKLFNLFFNKMTQKKKTKNKIEQNKLYLGTSPFSRQGGW